MVDRPIDLFRPFMSAEARRAAMDVLIPEPATGRLYIGQGEMVEQFELRLKQTLRTETDVLTVNSCTSALDLSLHLAGIVGQDPLDRIVISTPMTCTATNSPVVTRGARILWADVDPLTGLIDPSSVEERIYDCLRRFGQVPAAVLAVDWGGRLCDYPSLRAACAADGIPVIQDAAHSLGTTVHGLPFTDPSLSGPGGHPLRGDFVCFSFQAIKALTSGDGGALICPDEETTERARLLRWYGLDRRSSQDFRCSQRIEEVGYKYHMNDISAAIGLGNLLYVERVVGRARDTANWYGATLHGLRGVILPPAVRDPDFADGDESWWLFTLLVSDRDSFITFMKARGIDCSPVHARNDVHPAFIRASAAGDEYSLPGVDFFASHEAAIPVGWWLTDLDRERVALAVQDWSREHGADLELPAR